MNLTRLPKRLLNLFLGLSLILVPAAAHAQTAHGAKLAWTPATTTGITGVNIYRCLGVPSTCLASQPTNFTNIALVPVSAGATYTDSTSNLTNPPTSGSAYVYQLTSQCPTSGSTCAGESAPSAQVVATIPLSPSPATGITVVTF